MKKKAAIFWSGGKDSALSLYRAMNDSSLEICCMVSTFNKNFMRLSMHGVRETLIEQQAQEIGLPLVKMYVSTSTNNEYESELHKVFSDLKSKDIYTIIYGDIFLEDLRKCRDNILTQAGMHGVYPLWKESTTEIINQFWQLNFKTITCCVSSNSLTQEHLGVELNEKLISQLPQGVDACGENGEFHTFCFEGPIFKNNIKIKVGEIVFKPLEEKSSYGFWYADLLLK